MQKRQIAGACVLLSTILLLSAAALEPIITGLETADMQVGESEKWLWDKMWESKMLTDEQLSHVYEHGRLPGGTVVEDSPLDAEKQQAFSALAEHKIISGKELAEMLMDGSIEGMTTREVKAFEDLAEIYKPGPPPADYKQRRKYIVCDMIRHSKKAKKALAECKARVDTEAERRGIPLAGSDRNGKTAVITDFDEHGMPVALITHNAQSAAFLRTDELYPGGAWYSLTGEGMLAGVWDLTEVRETHQEFASNQVEQMDAAYAYDPTHATAVAAIMGATGKVAAVKGMAPGLAVHVWDSADLGDTFPDAVIDYPNLQISAHPYGYAAGWYKHPSISGEYWWRGSSTNSTEVPYFGAYSHDAWQQDGRLYDAPYNLMVYSSGDEAGEEYNGEEHYCWYHGTWTNDYHPADGGATGYDTLNQYATPKNTLVVGTAYETGPTNGPWTYHVHTNSSRGPTDDGRIKPDMVACTPSLVYTAAGTSDSAYSYLQRGSSFTAAAVAGSLTLIQKLHEEYYGTNSPMLASTLKALAIHDARDITPTGPDYVSGWGIMDTLDTAWQISDNTNYFESIPFIKEIRLDETQEKSSASFMFKSFGAPKVTMCWTDPRGAEPPYGVQHNSTNLMLVNDIDLRIYGPHDEGDYMGGATNYPWVLDPQNPANAATRGDNFRDNVEQVQVSSSASTSEWYTAVVSHKGTLSNGYQDISMVLPGSVLPQDGPVFEFSDAHAVGSNGVVSLVWTGVVGAAYQIQQAPDLVASNLVWTNINTVAPNHEGDVTWTNDISTVSNMFYRLKRLR